MNKLDQQKDQVGDHVDDDWDDEELTEEEGLLGREDVAESNEEEGPEADEVLVVLVEPVVVSDTHGCDVASVEQVCEVQVQN